VDLAQANLEPIPVRLGGETYRVRPRPLAELGELQALYKRSIPSPLTRTLEAIDQADRRGAKLSEGLKRLAISTAQREPWPPRVGSLAWLTDLDEAGLAPEVVRFALAPEHPDVDLTKATQLVADADSGELSWLVLALFHGRGEGDLRPKAPAGATTTETTTPPEMMATTTPDTSASETTGPASSATSP
jgi:hypothetical protein